MAFPRILLSYLTYYIASLLLNAFLIAFYAVQALTSHPDCLTQSGTNISHRFEFALTAGLTLAVVEGVNTNVCGIILRLRI